MLKTGDVYSYKSDYSSGDIVGLICGLGPDQRPLRDLPASLDEVRAVAKITGGTVFIGVQPTPAWLRTLTSPSILHLATHGFLRSDPQKPASNADLEPTVALSRAGIIMASAIGSKDNTGTMTALDVSSLRLDGTQIVVLAACDSGSGITENWDWHYGLPRAFFSAGASSVVASLWKARDDATTDLMKDFYSQLKAGANKAKALQHAQAFLAGQSRFSHPHFWAGFILIGDSSPLDLPKLSVHCSSPQRQ